MSLPRKPQPARLVISLIAAPQIDFAEIERQLNELFGECDFVSDELRFDNTDYYTPEMGSGLTRRFCSFKKLVERDRLAAIKLATNDIEQRYTTDGRRAINLDPGILTPENFVLATGKNFAHRIYLGSGIFGDLTLTYRGDSYRKLSWTYPDYATEQSLAMFQRIRSAYMKQFKNENPSQNEGEG